MPPSHTVVWTFVQACFIVGVAEVRIIIFICLLRPSDGNIVRRSIVIGIATAIKDAQWQHHVHGLLRLVREVVEIECTAESKMLVTHRSDNPKLAVNAITSALSTTCNCARCGIHCCIVARAAIFQTKNPSFFEEFIDFCFASKGRSRHRRS